MRRRHLGGPSGRRLLLGPVIVGVMLVACSSPSARTGGCSRPPVDAMTNSPVPVVVNPNPVAAGSVAELTVEIGGGVGESDIVGAGVEWQCWDGSGWRVTHQVVRGFSGDPVTEAVDPGTATTVPAVGLPVPARHPILVPMVDPGIYRIWEEVIAEDGALPAYAFVEVVAPDS